MTDVKKEWGTINIVVLNNHYDDKGKYYGTRIQQFIDGKVVDRASAFTLKPKERPIVGVTYTIEALVNSEGIYTARFHTLKFADVEIEDKEFIRNIDLLERSNKTAADALSQAIKSAKSSDDILECMRPLRKAYQKTNRLGQMAMEVRLLNYLRNGKDL
jgi:hypothetical protein